MQSERSASIVPFDAIPLISLLDGSYVYFGTPTTIYELRAATGDVRAYDQTDRTLRPTQRIGFPTYAMCVLHLWSKAFRPEEIAEIQGEYAGQVPEDAVLFAWSEWNCIYGTADGTFYYLAFADVDSFWKQKKGLGISRDLVLEQEWRAVFHPDTLRSAATPQEVIRSLVGSRSLAFFSTTDEAAEWVSGRFNK